MTSNLKRPRSDEDGNPSSMMLNTLLSEGRWEQVIERLNRFPSEAATLRDPSPLAVACRSGAPIQCVKFILEAAPDRLRHVLDSRGTPLHEAVVCEYIGLDVIDLLLKTDEQQGNDTTRATLLQDVDGFTPLHLLIRRRFQSHIQKCNEDSNLMKILEMLVSSCPEAVVIPDRGEYEEPPIVYAIKANIYAPSLGSEDDTLSRVERQIYEMVYTMLKHAPSAAAQVFSGFRGQYTALHSAVFHGRYTSTIELLLETEKNFPASTKAALLTNTQCELPLHFCAMRGERPRTVAVLAKAAPEAVLKRDATGLTPFHWLWIRFISTLLALDEDRRGGEELNILVRTSTPILYESSRYDEFATIEQGDFDADLHLIKRLDPPVDFLRMRHIPIEVSGHDNCFRWANQSYEVLNKIRDRYCKREENDEQTWTRQEVIVSLFWVKSVSLLQASNIAQPGIMPQGDSIFVHTAFASVCCLPPAAHLVARLFPDELSIRDLRGRLPIHYAACRPWHRWDWQREDNINEAAAARLLGGESLDVLRVAIDASSKEAMHVYDNENRLVLHCAIETFVRACSPRSQIISHCSIRNILLMLRELVQCHPESLHKRDGKTMLVPFLEAAAIATEQRAQSCYRDELSLSITYVLLRQNPAIISEVI